MELERSTLDAGHRGRHGRHCTGGGSDACVAPLRGRLPEARAALGIAGVTVVGIGFNHRAMVDQDMVTRLVS